MRKLLGAATAASALLAAMPAQAGHFIGVYTTFGGAPTTATIHFTTDDATNSVGGHDVLSISGSVDGDAIAALVANPNQPGVATSADGMWNYDNVYFDANPQLDTWGLLFTTASGGEYNLYGNAPSNFTLYASANGQFGANSTGTFDIAAVPETATWAMMLVGFGAMGVAMRRRSAVSFA